MSEDALLRAQLVALQSRVERVEHEVSQIMSDMNIEKGHRKLFRMFSFLFFIIVVGMSAWTQVENRALFSHVILAIEKSQKP